MSEPPQATSDVARPKASPERFELRTRPQPVTRINRRTLIGAASLVLIGIAALVLVALRPPALRPEAPELYSVDRKPISDGLSRLPASYEGLPRTTPPDQARSPASNVPRLDANGDDPLAAAQRADEARLARMAGQAREAPVFFRLQSKAPPRDAQPATSTTERSARATSLPDGDKESSAAVLAERSARRLRALDSVSLDSPPAAANEASRKLSVLKAGPEKEIYNPHTLQSPVSRYQLMAGTIIAASLVSGLNSDLPGLVIAHVTEHVFDSVAGRHLLIPQGSRLIGKYDNVIAFGQRRALVVWQRLIRPDGASVVIDNLPGTDTGGYAGLADEIDLHTWQLLKGVALATVLGVGSSLAFGQTGADSDLVRALRESTGQTTNRAGQRLVEMNLNVQPTVTVRPGWPLRVIVHKDIVLSPYRSPTSN